MHEGTLNVDISTALVRRLVDAQFPQWADLPLAPVPTQGHDNRTFRLGARLAVRLPSHEAYAAGIAKEDRVLPMLANHVEVAIPVPVASGRPSGAFPLPWSVRRWIPGDAPSCDPGLDRVELARDVGAFLSQMRAAPAVDAWRAGAHSFHRGSHPSVYDDEVHEALRRLGDSVDQERCRGIWAGAVATAWTGPPVWLHGDLTDDNLVTVAGRLTGVIDFGTCAVGDPACDLMMAWTFFEEDERAAFRAAVGLPAEVWARSRGWALWKALVTLADDPEIAVQARALAALLGEV